MQADRFRHWWRVLVPLPRSAHRDTTEPQERILVGPTKEFFSPPRPIYDGFFIDRVFFFRRQFIFYQFVGQLYVIIFFFTISWLSLDCLVRFIIVSVSSKFGTVTHEQISGLPLLLRLALEVELHCQPEHFRALVRDTFMLRKSNWKAYAMPPTSRRESYSNRRFRSKRKSCRGPTNLPCKNKLLHFSGFAVDLLLSPAQVKARKKKAHKALVDPADKITHPNLQELKTRVTGQTFPIIWRGHAESILR